MPARSKLEPVVGTIDGANVAFETSQDYQPGSLRVWLPLAQPGGVTEDGGKSFTLAEAPETDDTVLAWYRTIS